MKIKTLVTAAVLSLVSLTSHAGVIYEFQSIEEKSRNMHVRMEFENSVIVDGHFSLYAQGMSAFNKGLISLSVYGIGVGASFSHPSFWLDQANLRVNVGFNPGGFLSGGFYINDGFTEISMTNTSNRFWEVTGVRSDYTSSMTWCGFNSPACDLGRGMVRRTDVPEPSSIALFGLGLAAAVGIRRRVKR